MKRLSLSIIRELRCEYSLDVLRVGGEEDATAGGGSFDGVGPKGWGRGVEPVEPSFEVLVGFRAVDGADYEVDVWF